MSTICIYDSMARTFWDLYDDLKRDGHAEYWLKGGRGSTKSSFISLVIVRGLLAERERDYLPQGWQYNQGQRV